MERGLERKECSKEKNKYMFKIQKKFEYNSVLLFKKTILILYAFDL